MELWNSGLVEGWRDGVVKYPCFSAYGDIRAT